MLRSISILISAFVSSILVFASGALFKATISFPGPVCTNWTALAVVAFLFLVIGCPRLYEIAEEAWGMGEDGKDEVPQISGDFLEKVDQFRSRLNDFFLRSKRLTTLVMLVNVYLASYVFFHVCMQLLMDGSVYLPAVFFSWILADIFLMIMLFLILNPFKKKLSLHPRKV